jgi:plasmid maintenance system antidote protein VapI
VELAGNKFLFKLLLISVTVRIGAPLFPGEIISLPHAIYFELLQIRLIANVHQRVQRGELTERGLARGTGISQPHLHNMLKGVRVLSPTMADLLLRHLHMSVLDLLDTDDLPARHPLDRAS